MLLKPFKLHFPRTLDSALNLYKGMEGVRIQAGGTFLINNLKLLKKKGVKTPENILSLAHIRDLKGIGGADNKIIIKSMTTLDELLCSIVRTDNLSVLKTVARNIATQQIRNMATVGGNLTCRYTWTEMPAAMIALEADMHFAGADGREEILPAEEFFKNEAKTDKIFTHVTIKKERGALTAYFRVKKSLYVDIPILSLCIKTRFADRNFENTVVAVNNGVAFAQRDYALEGFLNGRPATDRTVEEALARLDASIYDARSTDYKRHMFRVGIKTTLRELIQQKSRLPEKR
jgi:CO/xanthine dehydrogenase FAD-binding subunit